MAFPLKQPFSVYLLSKEGDNPRRIPALKQAQKVFGNRVELIFGPDATQPESAQRFFPLSEESPRLLPGYRACCAAHATAFRHLIDSPFLDALILEDDASLEGTREEFIRLFGSLPPDYDWCKLYHQVSEGQFVRLPPKHLRAGETPLERHRVAESSWGNVAYFISKKGARYLLTQCNPQYTTIDCIFRFKAQDRVAYNTHGSLAYPSGSESFILTPGCEQTLQP